MISVLLPLLFAMQAPPPDYRHCAADNECVAVFGICQFEAVNRRYAKTLGAQWREELKRVKCAYRADMTPPNVQCVNQICEQVNQ